MDLNEIQFGRRVRQVLNQGLNVRPQVAERLRLAREQALTRHREQPATELAAGGGRRFGSLPGIAVRVLVPVAMLAVAAAGLYLWQQNQRVAELEEIDAQLLSDDLPPDAYLDRGFQNWLKKRAAEE